VGVVPISPMASSSSFFSASKSTLSRSSLPPWAILPSGAVTDGRPFLSHLNFNVNLGPISCRRALVGESNTYLVLALYLALDRELESEEEEGKREIKSEWEKDSPVTSEEQEITLIMKSHNLTSFELRHRWEKGLENPAY
jgi:hypothetical protein